jgi:hypothetical protein
MGIARGGNIKQDILEDTYGAESWSEERRGSITIHIVNSEVYQAITGLKPPPSPITPKEYAHKNIPWYNSYDEHSPVLIPGKIFRFVKSIVAFEQMRGYASVTPETIQIPHYGPG